MRSILAFSVILILSFLTFSTPTQAQQQAPAASRFSVVLLRSDPSEADVRLDSTYFGKTPLTLRLTNDVPHTLLLHKSGHLPLQCTVGSHHDDTLTLTMKLEPGFGSMTIIGGGTDRWISVDGKEIGKERIDSLVLPLGVHHIAITDHRYERSASQAVVVDQQRHSIARASFGTVSLSRLFTGLVLPGYAQLDDRAYVKGTILSLAGAGTLIALVSSVVRYEQANADYRGALSVYDRATGELAAAQARFVVDRRAVDYDTVRKQLVISATAAVVVWALNAIDLAFNHALTDRIDVFAGSASGAAGIAGMPDQRIGLAWRLP